MSMISDLADTVVVFDLDDTLYPEEVYVRSGMVAACALAADLYGTDHAQTLLTLRDEGQQDWLAELCERLPQGACVRDCLLWAYRLHTPTITLEPSVRALVSRVKAEAKATAIITDGRSVTQRLKLKALGLSMLRTYISEEHGSLDKPDPARFEAVMADFPASAYLYVADNPAKDFVAPRALGWRTVGVIGQASRVHALDEALPSTYQPDFWIPNVAELFNIAR
jgi:putative hydrolase of the HAD superfamily